MNATARNIVIILALAALVVVLPGGGAGADTALQALQLVFLGSIVWFVGMMYRQHRVALYSLGDARRAILYVEAGVVVVTLVARQRMFETSTGKVAWVVLLVGAAYAAFSVIWSARRY